MPGHFEKMISSFRARHLPLGIQSTLSSKEEVFLRESQLNVVGKVSGVKVLNSDLKKTSWIIVV